MTRDSSYWLYKTCASICKRKITYQDIIGPAATPHVFFSMSKFIVYIPFLSEIESCFTTLSFFNHIFCTVILGYSISVSQTRHDIINTWYENVNILFFSPFFPDKVSLKNIEMCNHAHKYTEYWSLHIK